MPVSREVLLALWGLCAAVLVGCAAASRVPGRPVMPITGFVARVTARAAWLAVVVLCWAWAGWHFFAR